MMYIQCITKYKQSTVQILGLEETTFYAYECIGITPNHAVLYAAYTGKIFKFDQM